jgi:hypothetical protein
MIQRKSYLQDDWKKFIATRLGEKYSYRMLTGEGQTIGLKDCKRNRGSQNLRDLGANLQL